MLGSDDEGLFVILAKLRPVTKRKNRGRQGGGRFGHTPFWEKILPWPHVPELIDEPPDYLESFFPEIRSIYIHADPLEEVVRTS